MHMHHFVSVSFLSSQPKLSGGELVQHGSTSFPDSSTEQEFLNPASKRHSHLFTSEATDNYLSGFFFNCQYFLNICVLLGDCRLAHRYSINDICHKYLTCKIEPICQLTGYLEPKEIALSYNGLVGTLPTKVNVSKVCEADS
jgi:hypothetical protein